jgi:L-serine dehydratase
MFISVLELFKIGIGPSSSHTMGPMVAAKAFLGKVRAYAAAHPSAPVHRLRCTLRGSLSLTGRGHATDRAVALGFRGHTPADLAGQDVDRLAEEEWAQESITLEDGRAVAFSPTRDITFDKGPPLPEHPNGMIFELVSASGEPLLSETCFSIGGGFVHTLDELRKGHDPGRQEPSPDVPYAFATAGSMLRMSASSGKSVADMKRENEWVLRSPDELERGLDAVWAAMQDCVRRGLATEGNLPGGLHITRRARALHDQLLDDPGGASLNDWLCAYAMAVNEENAAGHAVVTAPTNGAAGVIPSVLNFLVVQEGFTIAHVRTFLLTAAAIGGLIKHRGSLSGAEVGCQGEVGSASSMAAAGLCAVLGGTAQQIENAAEIALEHHLGLTCDPVQGLVQVPCIERNGFGAIKAHAAASLALRGTGQHVMSLDACITAMKQTGLEMSDKYKETSLGGLAVSYVEC